MPVAAQSPARGGTWGWEKWIHLGKMRGKICPESGRWEGATPKIPPRLPDRGPQGDWGPREGWPLAHHPSAGLLSIAPGSTSRGCSA